MNNIIDINKNKKKPQQEEFQLICDECSSENFIMVEVGENVLINCSNCNIEYLELIDVKKIAIKED